MLFIVDDERIRDEYSWSFPGDEYQFFPETRTRLEATFFIDIAIKNEIRLLLESQH